jgi:hypothetical protein
MAQDTIEQMWDKRDVPLELTSRPASNYYGLHGRPMDP